MIYREVDFRKRAIDFSQTMTFARRRRVPMLKVKYVEHNGKEHEVNVPEGWSVMEGAVGNFVPGIVADCGGDGGCATCPVYVDPAWLEKLPPMERKEEKTLHFALEVAANSRLSCFIKLSAGLDGLVVHMPKAQY
jgi:2Fe-2S ferredoxin